MNILGAVVIVLGVIACFAIKDTVGSVNLDVVGFILIMGGLVAMLAGIVARARRRSMTYPSVGAQHSWNTTGRPSTWGIQADAAQLGALWPTGTMTERFAALPRMIRAAGQGSYLGLPRRQLMLWLLSIIYIASPIDIIPELLPLIGVADDAGVLVWIVTNVMTEAGRFLSWERSRAIMLSNHT
jgi:uncharacterized membrane protein YkvA (DUF1232 family)